MPSKALMLTNGSGLYKVFSTESVLNLLHCLYCRKPYKDPRLLHCGHTYCLPCLVQMNRYSTIQIFTTLYNNFTNSIPTALPNYTQTLEHFATTFLQNCSKLDNENVHIFTKPYTTLHNFTKLCF